jgi:hypothetical protein
MYELHAQIRQAIALKDYETAIPLLKQAIRNQEKRKHGHSPWPYERLAVIYRHLKQYQLEIEVIERFANQCPVRTPAQEKLLGRLSRARELAASTDENGRRRGKCEMCDAEARTLTRIESGHRICSTCLKEFRPERPNHLATVKELEIVRLLGFEIPDDAGKEHVAELIDLHAKITHYVFDVWEALTGMRATQQLGSRFALQPFVTSICIDRTRAKRISAVQRHREEIAFSRMTQEQRTDPHRYIHLATTKPSLGRDEEFAFVVEALRREFPQFLKKQGFFSRLFG